MSPSQPVPHRAGPRACSAIAADATASGGSLDLDLGRMLDAGMTSSPCRLPALPLLPHHRGEGRHAVGLLLLRREGPLELDVGEGLHLRLADGVPPGLLAALELLHPGNRVPLLAEGLVLLHLPDALQASQGLLSRNNIIRVIRRLVVVRRSLINNDLAGGVHRDSVGEVGGGLDLSALGLPGGADNRLGGSCRSEVEHFFALSDHGRGGLFALGLLPDPPLDGLPGHQPVVVALRVNALLAVLRLLCSVLFNEVVEGLGLGQELSPCLPLLHALDVVQQGHMLLWPDVAKHVIWHTPEHLVDALPHEWAERVGRLGADHANGRWKDRRQVVVTADGRQDVQEAEQCLDHLLVCVLSKDEHSRGDLPAQHLTQGALVLVQQAGQRIHRRGAHGRLEAGEARAEGGGKLHLKLAVHAQLGQGLQAVPRPLPDCSSDLSRSQQELRDQGGENRGDGCGATHLLQ
mmetsp:Transcript_32713/g.84826  ORF Transcript_32713/g.84826 Transcript_32713/m.84826 type:complete len:462 (-) Transcript_32713:2376-3761(-)